MSKGFATPLWLELRVPRWWVLLLGLSYASALLLILLLPLAWYWLGLLLVLWLAGAFSSLAPLLYPQKRARIERACWGDAEHWQLYFTDDRMVAASLSPRLFSAGPLLQLHLQTEDGRSQSLLLLPGMLASADLRRLRVRLRLFVAGQLPNVDSQPVQ